MKEVIKSTLYTVSTMKRWNVDDKYYRWWQ